MTPTPMTLKVTLAVWNHPNCHISRSMAYCRP